MILHQTGLIDDDFYVLGHHANPVFLLDGDQPVLFEGGFACLAPLYIEAARDRLKGRSPRAAYLTHVHFDHCGAAGYLSGAFPEMEVFCSPLGRAILERPNAQKLIRELNDFTENAVMEHWQISSQGSPYIPFEVHRVCSEGDVLPGNGGIVAYETPGHTRDHTSYYIPDRGILLAGEAMGTMDYSGYIVMESLLDVDLYLASFRKLAELNPKVIVLGHLYIITGDDVPAFIEKALADGKKFLARSAEAYEKTGGDMRETLQKVRAWEYDPKPFPKQPEPAFMLNLAARVQASLRHQGILRQDQGG